jgi:hypothetical protein
MRKLILGIVAAVCLFSASTVRADAIYNFSLTVDGGTIAPGTLTFTINSAPTTGFNDVDTYFQKSGLKALTLSIGGDTFTLNNASGTFVQFIGGTLDAVEFFGNLPSSTATITASAAGLGYTFFDGSKSYNVTGEIVPQLVNSSASAVPEPSTLTFVGTAFLAGVGLVRRRLA